jgi:hypothetical protein
MKRDLIKAFCAAGGLAVLMAIGTLNTSSAQSAVGGGGRLEGTWDVQVSINDCHGHVIRTFPSRLMYIAGGTFVESTSGIAPALKTPGFGVWSHTTGNTYAVTFKFFIFDTTNTFTGWQIVRAQLSLNQTADAYTASGTVQIYDTSGNLIGSGCVTTVGTRVEL